MTAPVDKSDSKGFFFNDNVSRRAMIAGLGSAAALAAVGQIARGQNSASPPSDSASHNTSNKGPSDDGPNNLGLRQENPESWDPPHSDSGDVNTFKYPFAFGHNRVSDGGWARQVTQRDLPIAKDIAGVNMRLEPYAIRELHWHVPGEWSLMLSGSARVTAVDPQGKNFVGDVGPGDLWFFAGGSPHSIQALQDGCEFLLAFDDGMFSEFDTFLITDWLHHTPREVISKNFQMPESTFDPLPDHELYIFNAPAPASLADDIKAAMAPEGMTDVPLTYKLLDQKPDFQMKGGEVRIADSTRFKASTSIAVAHVILHPGGLRVPHWHPNADEWQYYSAGQGRMTVFTGGGKARTMNFQAGDVGYIPRSLPHYIENTGNSDLVFIELFKSPVYQSIAMSEWISRLPPELVQAHLKLPLSVIKAVPKQHFPVVPV